MYYFQAAESGFFSSELWAGGRSPLPPLIFKLCGRDPERIRTLFAVLSALSWALLALAVSRFVTSPYLKPLAAALVVSLGLSQDIVFWNECILSESLSFSSAALWLAAVLMFYARPARWLAPVVLCSLAFGLSRDSNAYLLLMLGLLMAAGALILRLRHRPWWPQLALALTFTGVFLLTNISADHGRRWRYPLTNVIVLRVLPNQIKLQKFLALGMPNGPGLRPGRPRRKYDSEPRLQGFRDWVSSSGKSAYVRYLVTSPLATLREPKFEEIFGVALTSYAPKGLPSAEPAFVELFWDRTTWHLRAILCGVLAAAVLVRPRLSQSPLATTGFMLAILVYPQALLIWHGDAMEVPRHAAQVAFQLQVALALLLASSIDVLARTLSSRRGDPPRLPARQSSEPQNYAVPSKLQAWASDSSS
jgi:hypothetical protein